MSKDKTREIFEHAPIPKAVFLNIIPSIISMVMVLVYNIADTYFISLTRNPLMVASVSLASPVFLFFMAVGILFGIGGTSLIARLLGEGRKQDASHTASFCFWSAGGVGVLGTIFILIAVDWIATFVGASSETFVYVKEYIQIVAFGVPFLIIGNSFSNIIRAEGNANKAMMGMIIGNLVNIVLDPILILGFGLNVKGAAIATIIGNICAAAYYIGHYVLGKSLLSIHIKNYKIKGGIMLGVLAIGIPASLNTVLMSFSNVIINNFIKEFGDMAVAGLGVAMRINMIAVMLLIGLGVGIQPLLGYCFGADNKKRFVGVLKFSLFVAIILSIIMTGVCYFFAGPMVHLFLEEQQAYEYGMIFARTLVISGPTIGVLFVMINAIQSMGAAFSSLILSISRQGLIYIPVVVTFSKLTDSAGALVFAQPLTDYLATILALILFFFTFRTYFRRKDALRQQTEGSKG